MDNEKPAAAKSSDPPAHFAAAPCEPRLIPYGPYGWQGKVRRPKTAEPSQGMACM